MGTEQAAERNPLFTEKEECCSCFACYEICPVKAIVMLEDSEGFLYPYVDETTCIHCNLCRKVCPFYHSAAEITVLEEAKE